MSSRRKLYAFLLLFAIAPMSLLLIAACTGAGGAVLLRANVYAQTALDPGLDGGAGGGIPGGGAGADNGDNTGTDNGNEDDNGGELATDGTFTVTFINQSSEEVEVVLWATDQTGSSTAIVQSDANLVPLGPEGFQTFVGMLDMGDIIQAEIECVAGRSISAAASEALVLLLPEVCISPPLRQGSDFECTADSVIDQIILIRDGSNGGLELVAASQIYLGCGQ